MKEKLPFVWTIIICMIIFFLILFQINWLDTEFKLPGWFSQICVLVSLGIFFEIGHRLNVKGFDAPMSQFIKLSKKDKVISLIALLAIIFIPRLGLSFNSGGINFLFLFLGFLAFGFIRSFIGRKELSNTGTHSQDNSHPKN